MAEFGKAHIPITEVAEKYFGLNDKEAKLKAARAKFPFPVFKCSTQDGQNKCPWLVDIADKDQNHSGMSSSFFYVREKYAIICSPIFNKKITNKIINLVNKWAN